MPRPEKGAQGRSLSSRTVNTKALGEPGPGCGRPEGWEGRVEGGIGGLQGPDRSGLVGLANGRLYLQATGPLGECLESCM